MERAYEEIKKGALIIIIAKEESQNE